MVITRILWCMMLLLNNFDGVIPGLNLPMHPNFLYILNVFSERIQKMTATIKIFPDK